MPVYPRVCGGTPAAQYSGNTAPRLSPRMRGNLHHQIVAAAPAASIPAYAGEPSTRANSAQEESVYPRVCGGTAV